VEYFVVYKQILFSLLITVCSLVGILYMLTTE